MKIKHILLTSLFLLFIPSCMGDMLPGPIQRIFQSLFGGGIPPWYVQKGIFALIIMCVFLMIFKGIKMKTNITTFLAILLAIVAGIGVPTSITQAMFTMYGWLGGIIVSLGMVIFMLIIGQRVKKAMGGGTMGGLARGLIWLVALVALTAFSSSWANFEFAGKKGSLTSFFGLAIMILSVIIVIDFVKALSAAGSGMGGAGGGGGSILGGAWKGTKNMFNKMKGNKGKAPVLNTPQGQSTLRNVLNKISDNQNLAYQQGVRSQREIGTLQQFKINTQDEERLETEIETRLQDINNQLQAAINQATNQIPVLSQTETQRITDDLNTINQDSIKLFAKNKELKQMYYYLDNIAHDELRLFMRSFRNYRETIKANISVFVPVIEQPTWKALDKYFTQVRKATKAKHDKLQNSIRKDLDKLIKLENKFRNAIRMAVQYIRNTQLKEAQKEIKNAIDAKADRIKILEDAKNSAKQMLQFERIELFSIKKEEDASNIIAEALRRAQLK